MATHKIKIEIEINCGEDTCWDFEAKKLCKFVGVRRIGTVWSCLLYPSNGFPYTDLISKNGYLQRCEQCKSRSTNIIPSIQS